MGENRAFVNVKLVKYEHRKILLSVRFPRGPGCTEGADAARPWGAGQGGSIRERHAHI
jgi:hypothetical protein